MWIHAAIYELAAATATGKISVSPHRFTAFQPFVRQSARNAISRNALNDAADFVAGAYSVDIGNLARGAYLIREPG